MASPIGQQFGFPIGLPTQPGGAEVRHDAFGKDLYFDDDLHVTPAGDYMTIEGVPALRAAIQRRLVVRPGEYKMRPQYGVGAGTYVKKNMTQAMLDQLRLRIISNLQHEARIERVLDVKLEKLTMLGGAGGLRVLVSVQSIGRQVNLAPFDIMGG